MPGRNQNLPKPRPIARGTTTLPDAVSRRFGFGCPCCGVPMTHAKPKRFAATPANKATVGHDVAIANGGHEGAWYWQCNRCNNDQGFLDLVTWGRKLVYAGDRRAERVVEVAAFVRSFVAAWRGAEEEVA